MDILGCRVLCVLLATAGTHALTIVDASAETVAQADNTPQSVFIKLRHPPAAPKSVTATPTAAEIAASEKLLAEAEALMQEGKPAAAYALLEPLEFERSGEVRFDYLIGIAALDSGKPDKATIAFERVLAVDPNFAGARLDMARAYFQLGDTPRAKTEFEAVLTQNPPEAAKATIEKYLAAIAAQENVRRTHISGYIEGMAGHDNNVNNSTSESQIVAFGNLLFTLSPTNVKTADDYIGLAAGIAVEPAVNARVALYAGADVHQRGNMSKTNFDYYSLDGRAGLTVARGAEIFRAGVLASQYVLASARNRETTGINAEWRHTVNPANQLNASVLFTRNRFADASLQTNDFDQYTVGAGWLHVMADGKSVVFGSLFYGSENDVAPVTASNPSGGRADGNKRLTGLRLGGQMPLGERWDIFASLGTQAGKYDKTNVSFLSMRDDRLDDISIGANWQWKKQWTVRPQLAWSRNDSNIAIYNFDRIDASVTVRKDFK